MRRLRPKRPRSLWNLILSNGIPLYGLALLAFVRWAVGRLLWFLLGGRV